MSIQPDSPTQARLWSRDFLLLFSSALLTWISFYFLLPTLPIYIERELLGDPAQVGLVSSMLTITAIAARLLAGYAMDRWGRRRIQIGFLALFALVVFAYRWATTLWMLAVIRFLHGIPFGAATTASHTVAADLVPSSRRGEGLSYFGLATTLAMAVGPALALNVLGDGEFTRLFLCAGAISVAGFVPALWVRYPDIRNENTSFSLPGLIEPRVGWLSLATLLTYVGYGGIITFITLYAAQFGIASAGWFFTAYACGLVLSRSVSGRVFDRQGPRPTIAAGLCLLFLSYVTLGLWHTETTYLASAVLLGLGSGTLTPTMFAMAANWVPPERRGAANATVFAALDVGIGGGSYLLGALAQSTGSYAVMYLVAGLGLVAPAALFFARVIPDYVRFSAQ